MATLDPHLRERLLDAGIPDALVHADHPAARAVIGVTPEPAHGFIRRDWLGPHHDRRQLLEPTVLRIHPPIPHVIPPIADDASVALGPSFSPARVAATREIVVEVLTNAVAHRDYRIDAPVTVDLYTNALVVTSPGLPEHADIVDGTFTGWGCRNPEVQALLRALGYGAQHGTGWLRATRFGADAGFAVTAQALEAAVEVTVRVDPDRRVALERSRRRLAETRSRLGPETHHAQVLDLLADGRWWAPKDIVRQVDIARSTLTGVLNDLVDKGRLVRSHASLRAPNQQYRRTDVSPAEPLD